MLASHRLREKITFQPNTPAAACVWAEVTPLGARLAEHEGGRVSVVRRYRIRVRREEVAPARGQSLLWDGRLLTVAAHTIAPEDRRLLVIEAEEMLG